MAKKKTQVVEETNDIQIASEIIIDATDIKEDTTIGVSVAMFSVKTSSNDIKLRKYPNVKDASSNIQGKMTPGKTYKVVAVIEYTPIKMYKLDNGYYIIADQNIKTI